MLNASERLCKKHKVSRDVPLHEFTTLKIGGNAELFAQPTSKGELVSLLDDCLDLGIPYRVMGRGSNLFITAETVPGIVIRNTEACTSLQFNGRKISVGASVSLQVLLKEAASRGLGGCEYLHSVPGNIGGAIYMNAGRGHVARRNLCDHVLRVEFFDGDKVRVLSGRKCGFGYRTSIFQQMENVVVLHAELKFNAMPPAEAQQLLLDRVRWVKEKQHNTVPNAGSVFRYDFALAEEIKGLVEGTASFSDKTGNWILNNGGTGSGDVERLIDRAIAMHEEQGLKKPTLEWTTWS